MLKRLFLFMLILLIIGFTIFLIMWMMGSAQYIKSKNKLKEYVWTQMMLISDEYNEYGYDYDKDPKQLKKINEQLINDLTKNLLVFYEYNYATFENTINNLISNENNYNKNKGLPSYMGSSTIDNFLENTARCIPVSVLELSVFYLRFFYMVYLTMNKSKTEIVELFNRDNIIDFILVPMQISPSCIN